MVYGERFNGPQWFYDSYYSDQNKHEYYFDPITGAMAHGWVTVKGQLRHYDEVTGIRIS